MIFQRRKTCFERNYVILSIFFLLAFVPMIAGALNNKEVVVSGLTVGIMGYAVCNYLGVLVASVLQMIL